MAEYGPYDLYALENLGRGSCSIFIMADMWSNSSTARLGHPERPVLRSPHCRVAPKGYTYDSRYTSRAPSTRSGVAEMATELTAFLDEPRKPIRNPATGRVADPRSYYYVVAAAVVLDGDAADARRRLGLVRADIGADLHYRNLSKTRRTAALEAIDRIGGWDCTRRGPGTTIRSRFRGVLPVRSSQSQP